MECDWVMSGLQSLLCCSGYGLCLSHTWVSVVMIELSLGVSLQPLITWLVYDWMSYTQVSMVVL
jgi:hypothetical protein